MYCTRCLEKLVFIKPINTCNIIISEPYRFDTYVLCNKCVNELIAFMGEKKSNMTPRQLEFWYRSHTDAVPSVLMED